MTFGKLLRAARRRWYLTVAGLAVTASVALYGSQVPGDWETSASLVLMVPIGEGNFNGYVGGGSVISAAGMLSAIMNGSEVRDDLKTAGLVDEYTIAMHNSGNQWANNYDRPDLDIQVRGLDPDSVRGSLGLLVERANAELAERQRVAGVAETNMINAQLVPAEPPVVNGRGSPARAVLAAMLAGITATLTLAMLVDTAIRRRQQITTSSAPAAPQGPGSGITHPSVRYAMVGPAKPDRG